MSVREGAEETSLSDGEVSVRVRREGRLSLSRL